MTARSESGQRLLLIAEAERHERIALGQYAWAEGLQDRVNYFRAVGDAHRATAQAIRDGLEAGAR